MQSSMTPISTPSPEAMYKKYTDLSTLHDPRVDEVLKRAALGGDPNYPQVYAIMAIQARTAAKGQAQQMQQAQGAQGPQPTVAENVLAKAAPVEQRMTQGMGSLPVAENTFHAAGGGMVSFADEGLVEGETPEDSDAAAAYGNFGKSMSEYRGTDPSIIEHGFFGAKRPKLAMGSAKAASAKANSDKAPDASTSGKKPDAGSDNKGFPAMSPEEKKRIRALSGPKEETKKDDKKGIAALKPDVTQAEKDIAAETTARYHKNVGEDPDAADRKARMEALGLSNAEAKRQAPWMALANAGFGMMAGPSQYAMQNIGAGAQQGLASLTDQQKDIARAQERHAAMQDAIGERDYARRAKGAELGMTAEAAAKKATQDESQFARDIASRERVAGITASAYGGYRGRAADIAEQRVLDNQMNKLREQLPLLSAKERIPVQAKIAQLQLQFDALSSGAGGPPSALAAAPDSSSLTATAPGKFTFNL